MASVPSLRPRATEFASSYASYVALAPEGDVLAALSAQLDEMCSLLNGLPEKAANTRHAPYTWTVKQVLGHLSDAERVFGHRAFRFARKDQTPLPSFDENDYVASAPFESYPLDELLAEFEHLRRANLSFFRYLPDDAWSRSGVANGNGVTVRALAYIIMGHAQHHLKILQKRLGAPAR